MMRIVTPVKFVVMVNALHHVHHSQMERVGVVVRLVRPVLRVAQNVLPVVETAVRQVAVNSFVAMASVSNLAHTRVNVLPVAMVVVVTHREKFAVAAYHAARQKDVAGTDTAVVIMKPVVVVVVHVVLKVIVAMGLV